jgi:predicted nucleic acid-binding protein
VTAFVDTSGLIALLDADDAAHGEIRSAWRHAVLHGEGLVMTDYVLVEAVAVAQRRWGLEGVRALTEEFLPLIVLESVPAERLRTAIDMMLATDRRRLSLVDCVSFAHMRSAGLREYLGLDSHFDEQGFRRYAPED